MKINSNSTFKEIRDDVLSSNSKFITKVKKVYDNCKSDIGKRRPLSFLMAVILGGVGTTGASGKYYDIFLVDKADTLWRNDVGNVLYGEQPIEGWSLGKEQKAIRLIDDNEKVSNYETVIKACFNKNNQGFENSKIDDPAVLKSIREVYNELFEENEDITLGELREQINREKGKFFDWINKKIDEYKEYFEHSNYDDNVKNSFMMLMAIILRGVSTGKSEEPKKSNVKFYKLLVGKLDENKKFNKSDIWWKSVGIYLGYIAIGNFDESEKFRNERKNDFPWHENIRKSENDDVSLNDLCNLIESDIDTKKLLGYNISSLFYDQSIDGSNGAILNDKNIRIKCLADQCKELIDYMKGGKEMNKNGNTKVEAIIRRNIENYNQVIFTGAPGTGKTHSVREYVKDKNYKFVQFHPSYDYSDFIEGLRPVTLGNSSAPTFVRIDGAFKKFCRNIVESNLNNIFVKWSTFSDDTKKKILEMIFVTNRNFDVVYELINIDSYSNLRDKLEKLIETIGRLRKMMFADNDIETTDNININNAGEDGKKNNDGDHFTTSKDVKEKVNEKEWEVINDVIRDESIDLSINDNYEFKWYYFVVDEINRADLSKVFGEIMFGLEESYRGIENRFDTQYMNLKTFEVDDNGNANRMGFDCFEKGFFIPRNLKFIGTMNDIDRSVESFDFALRRRFKWIDIKANEVMLESLKSILDDKTTQQDITIDKLADRVISMNNIISGDIGKKLGLNEAFHIGPAYFKDFDVSKNKIEDIFNSNIESILQEYTRGRREDEVKNFIEKCKIELLTDLNKAENLQSQSIANNNIPDVSDVNN